MLAALAGHGSSKGTTYELSRDFSPTNNPAGVWSFGAKPSLEGTFSLFTVRGLNPFEYWQLVPSQEPTIYRNGTTETIQIGEQGVFPPGTVFLYSGSDGATNGFGAVRFTAPLAGSYLIRTEVAPVYDGSSQGDTDFHVVKNGAEMFGRFLSAADSSSYSNELSLATGDTLDFMVGRGQDNNGTASGLKIQVSIAPASNPPSSELVINGSFELGSDPEISIGVNAPDSTTITGWTVEAASVDYIGTRWIAGDGVRCLDLSGTDAGTISQVISGLTPGQAYRLSFLMAGNPEVGLTLVRLRASVGATSGEFSFSPSGHSPGSLGWTEKTLDFVAGASSEKLSFVSLVPGWAGAALDGVSIAAGTNAPPEPPIPATHDLSRDFSLASNPNGVWSYGHLSGSPSGSFELLNTTGTFGAENGVPIAIWHLNNAKPWVAKVLGPETAVSDQFTGPPGTVYFGPDPSVEPPDYGAIRFIVPSAAAGVYRLETSVRSLYDSTRSVGADFHVLRNGVELFGQLLPPNSATGYSNTLALVEGDQIDFVAGRGTNGLPETGLKIQATLTQLTNTPPQPPSMVYNLGRDFALVNPNGVWSYGHQSAIGATFNLMASHQIVPGDSGVPILLWHTQSAPAIYGNTNDTAATSGGQSYPPNTAWCYAGPEGSDRTFAVMRFTVPADGAGDYLIASAVSPRVNSGGDDSDFHVVRNGVELFGQFLGATESGGYTNSVGLEAGDTIDFLVGRGANGRLYGSGLRIQATISLQSNTPRPPQIIAEPRDQTVVKGSAVAFAVSASGSSPLSYQWLFNEAPIDGANASTLTLDNVQLSQSGNYSVVVSNELGTATSANAVLVVYPPAATVRLVDANGAGAAEVNIPVELVANGNENAIGFSLNFNPGVMGFVGASLGVGVPSGAALLVNTNDAPAGRLGLVVGLPADEVFSEGTQQVALVTFLVAPILNQTTETVSFGDQPTLRQLSDVHAQVLPASFVGGTVSIADSQFEGDVAPRPNGDRSVATIDWVQMGRYVARLDTISSPNEFQRADCAPSATKGNGLLTASDWVQAGRYAVGLDPLALLGGPTEPDGGEGGGFAAASASGRLLGLMNTSIPQGQTEVVPVTLDCQGNENATSFSVSFDPAKLAFVSAVPGSGSAGSLLNLNTTEASQGRLGVALAAQPGRTFATGLREILQLRFTALATAPATASLTFGNAPVPREVSDVAANALPTGFTAGTVSVTPPPGPPLRVTRSGNSLFITWPSSATGFELEASEGALGTAWSLVPGVIDLGEQKLAVITIGSRERYFRLKKP